MRHIAIIGSGPAGCYLADSLLRLVSDAAVDIFERLPAPFGLVRYGVAPDHQGTKAIARVLDRVLGRDRISFFGNVEVGRDILLEDLMSLYDTVVLAIGASRDRRLNIPGEELDGVFGSGAFSGWYNSHPEHRPPAIEGVRSAVVVGNGNVAIDVARVLAKRSAELVGSDVSPDVTSWLETQPIETIHIVGRRGAADAKFTQHELAELGTLQRAVPIVADPATLAGNGAVVETLRNFVANKSRTAPVTINFHFNLTPVAFFGENGLRAVQFRSGDGTFHEIPAQLAVTCIGYETCACCSAALNNGVFTNEQGKIKDRLYVVGWARRGPSGTIPTNRAEAQQVAQRIAQEIPDGGRQGSASARQLLQQRQVHWADYAAWRRIDAAELARAGSERCRAKFTSVAEMIDAAQVNEPRSSFNGDCETEPSAPLESSKTN
jgi:NADPH-dependent glutamate synthase beta subunit-like oxidoreductase